MFAWWRSATPTQRAAATVGSVWLVFALVALIAPSGAALGATSDVAGVDVSRVQGLVHLIPATVLLWSAVAGPGPADAGVVAGAIGFAALAPLGVVALRTGFNPLAASTASITAQALAAVLLADVSLARWIGARRDMVVAPGSLAGGRRSEPPPGALLTLEQLTKTELLELARELDVRGRSRMRKDDLVEAIGRAA